MSNAIPAGYIPAPRPDKPPYDPTKGRTVVWVPPGFDVCIYSEAGTRMFTLDEAASRGLVIKHAMGNDKLICLNFQALRVQFLPKQ